MMPLCSSTSIVVIVVVLVAVECLAVHALWRVPARCVVGECLQIRQILDEARQCLPMLLGRAEVGSWVRDAERDEMGQISSQGVERARMDGETLDGQLPDLALCRSEQGEETLGGDPLAASDGQSAKARQMLCDPGEELVSDDSRVLG